MEDGWVYFIECLERPDFGIKIGFSYDIDARLASIARNMNCTIVVLAVVRGNERAEANLHSRFAHARNEGEWFHPIPEIREYISSLEDIGFPATVSPKRQKQPPEHDGYSRTHDREQAKAVLRSAVARLPRETTTAHATEILYRQLSEAYPGQWGRRRVKAIFHGEAHLIEHREMMQLRELFGDADGPLDTDDQ